MQLWTSLRLSYSNLLACAETKAHLMVSEGVWEKQITTVLLAELNSTLSYQIQKNQTQSQSRPPLLIFLLVSQQLSFHCQITLLGGFWYRLGKGDGGMVLPDKVIVVCSGVEGIYFPSLHL